MAHLHGPRGRDPLLLAAREPVAALTDDRLVAVGKRRDQSVDLRRPRGLLDLLVGRVGLREAQVLAHARVEEVRLLRDDADETRDRGEREIANVDAAYGAVRVLEKVSLAVNAGETVVLLGTNGNGKSTLMKCIMGIVPPRDGRIIAEIDGIRHDLVGRTTEEIVDLGIALVPEGRRLFPRLTVEENLLLGAYRPKARAQSSRSSHSLPSAKRSRISAGCASFPSWISASI